MIDIQSSIKESVNKRLVQAHKKGIPTVYLVDTVNPQWLSNYYLKYRPNYLYYSEGGEQELKLNVDRIYFAGGFFNLCAGETARDAFLGSDKNKTVRAVYLTDSLYILNESIKPLKSDLQGLTDAQTLAYLQGAYFPLNEVGTKNWRNRRHANFDAFTFKIFRDGREIGSFGKGPRKVEMNFIVDSEVLPD